MKPFGSGNCSSHHESPASACIRPATGADLAAIECLARHATQELLNPFLSAEQRGVTSAFTPLDPWLIEDGTYYVFEIDGVLCASGGWSRRSPLIHDPNSQSRQVQSEEAGKARIRAMYTDPAYARRGLGQSVLSFCETSARMAGISRLELIATPVGEFLYGANGYEVIERIEMNAPSDVIIQVARMQKHFKPGAVRQKGQQRYA